MGSLKITLFALLGVLNLPLMLYIVRFENLKNVFFFLGILQTLHL